MKQMILSFILCCFAQTALAVEITQVRAQPKVVSAEHKDGVQVVFALSESALVELHIYNSADELVKTVTSEHQMLAGDNVLTWDTRDFAGVLVPAEAYLYVLKATNGEASAEHDLTDLRGRKRMQVDDIKWDASLKSLSYFLPESGRVNIRVGLQNNGPLLGTIQSWRAQQSGLQQVAWGGEDASGVLELALHPKLDFWIDAFSFSDNTLLVEPSTERPTQYTRPDDRPILHRQIKKEKPKRMYDHAQQSSASRGDFDITLSLPLNLKKNKSGIPIVSGLVPLRLDVEDHDRKRALARRFEPVFFVDGTFAFENETGFLPMTWMWDTRGTNPGEHFLTVNFRGYEGNFGMATVRVIVAQ